MVRIADRAEAWLARRGYGRGGANEDGEDDALSLIQLASVAGRSSEFEWCASGEAGEGFRGASVPASAAVRDLRGVPGACRGTGCLKRGSRRVGGSVWGSPRGGRWA